MDEAMTVKLSIQLSGERAAFARSLVDSERYASVDDVMEAGLAVLYEKFDGENAAIVDRKRPSFAKKSDPNRCPTHPGALLREKTLPAIGKPNSEIADLLGISRRHLSEILREDRPVSAAMAFRFGKMFGNGPLMWVRMQAAYDTWHAVREVDISGIPNLNGV